MKRFYKKKPRTTFERIYETYYYTPASGQSEIIARLLCFREKNHSFPHSLTDQNNYKTESQKRG